MRNWYSAQELVGLPAMPSTERGVKKVACREHWEGQKRMGSKAVEYSFAVLPKETQTALIAASVASTVSDAPVEPHVISTGRDLEKPSRLNDSQSSVMSARLSFVREIERMSKEIGRAHV